MLQAADLTIRLHPEDDVVIARVEIPSGTLLTKENMRAIVTIPAGHKIAVRDIAQGQPARRYNQIIGFAMRPIRAGEHVHVHNLAMGNFERDYAFCASKKVTPFVDKPATFLGIVRADGRVATRNYIGILTSVNCSATVARMIARHFENRLEDFPNIDGVVALTHKTGCGIASEGEATELLRRTIAGYARHPNFHSAQLIGLGCEANQINDLLSVHQLKRGDKLGAFTIQEKGGTTNLMDVYEYAQAVTAKGFVYMDTPGYDPVSATGQVAGGANMILFTTGRGSAYGCKPAPSLKLATNTPLYVRQEDDMDINCGTVIDGSETIQQAGERIFGLILETASGRKSKSEEFGYGEDEFAPWMLGATM